MRHSLYRLKKAHALYAYQWNGIPDETVKAFDTRGSTWVGPCDTCDKCYREMKHHGVLRPYEREYWWYVCKGDYIIKSEEVMTEKEFNRLYEEV